MEYISLDIDVIPQASALSLNSKTNVIVIATKLFNARTESAKCYSEVMLKRIDTLKK